MAGPFSRLLHLVYKVVSSSVKTTQLALNLHSTWLGFLFCHCNFASECSKHNDTNTMYPVKPNGQPIDPESYSNASSSESMITGKPSPWDSLQNSLSVFWVTKQLLPKNADKAKVITTTLRELLTYCAFLMTITYITFSMMNPTMYYQTKIMSDLFLEKADSSGVSFKTASQMDHFWNVNVV